MSEDESKEATEPTEEGWEEVDGTNGPAPVTKPVEGAGEDRVYASKPTAPPWAMGMYTASAGLILALLLLVFPEFRQFSLTGTTTLETGYFLLVIPVIAILWALGSLVHKESTGDRGKALSAMVIAVVAGAVLGYAISTDPAKVAADSAVDEQQQRLDMTEEEMQQWREDKLDR